MSLNCSDPICQGTVRENCSSLAATTNRDQQSHNTHEFVSAPIGNTWDATINVEQSATTIIGNSCLLIYEVTYIT